MQSNESSYPNDWLRIAEKDWKRVEMLLKEGDPELAGFCLQQAVEKFLKAFLLSKGWQLRRIHNLDALLEDAIKYDPSLETYRSACQKITAFYVVERYPFAEGSQITKDDVRSSLKEVTGFVKRLRSKVRE